MTDGAHHADGGAGAARGQRLVGALATGNEAVVGSGHGLARTRQAGRPTDEVDVDRTEYRDHGGSSTGQSSCLQGVPSSRRRAENADARQAAQGPRAGSRGSISGSARTLRPLCRTAAAGRHSVGRKTGLDCTLTLGKIGAGDRDHAGLDPEGGRDRTWSPRGTTSPPLSSPVEPLAGHRRPPPNQLRTFDRETFTTVRS